MQFENIQETNMSSIERSFYLLTAPALSVFFFSLSAGLGRLSQAEEYLAQAQWTVLKTPECPDSIKSKLFRNLGLMYAAQGNYPDALSQLADDVRA